MRGSIRRQTRLAAAAVLALALICLGSSAATGSGDPKRGGAEEVFAVSTGNDSEIEKLLPIRKPSRSKKRVVMSLGPGDLPALQQDDRLNVTAELQLSTTCVDNSRRCIGRPYSLSPRMTAHLVIANSRRKTNGQRISSNDSKRCHQPRPHRNHHCVLVIKDGAKDVGNPANLPCPPDRCFVNLVASAESSRARSGNVVVVGADTPSGSVRQDKGRLDAVVLRGNGLSGEPERTKRRIQKQVPVGDSGQSGLRVIYSLPLRDLQRGDAYVAEARAKTSIGHLPYPVFIGTQMVVARRRTDPNPGRFPRKVVQLGGQVTEGNGFNCTHGNSAYETPCVSRKVGLLRVKQDAVDGRGDPVTLYLNLVANALPKRARAGAGADAQARRGGFLQAKRYRDPA
jgi:hypothetical protein